MFLAVTNSRENLKLFQTHFYKRGKSSFSKSFGPNIINPAYLFAYALPYPLPLHISYVDLRELVPYK